MIANPILPFVLLTFTVCFCGGKENPARNMTNIDYDIEEPLLYDVFPPDFEWGVATASYQIEGGWDEGGKGLSIWDTFTEDPDSGHVTNGDNGKVACDSYHKFKEDIQLIRNMGMSRYRFSIAWTRIQPSGEGQPNEEGIAYYNAVIDEAIAHGITPVVTLYHWDLPQGLQDQDGWLNEKMAFWFEEYARICFKEFGDRVKTWITLNEPWVTATEGYGSDVHAPGINEPGTADYRAAHNQIKAHAKAYRLYHREFSPSQKGKVGITLNLNYFQPEDFENESDVEASNTLMQFMAGWFANPILVNGKYPDIMRQKIDEKSVLQGFEESRLPTFTEEESVEIAHSSDFLGINHYTTGIVYQTPPEDIDLSQMSWAVDTDVTMYQDSKWYTAASSWLKVVPFGFRRTMNWLKDTYGLDLDIVITENGFSDFLGNLDDQQRIYYFKHYINQLLKAVKLDGCNVKGYFAWSLMDNFEWSQGYTQKFGTHSVDFNDPERPRTPKASAVFLHQLAADNGFVETGTK